MIHIAFEPSPLNHQRRKKCVCVEDFQIVPHQILEVLLRILSCGDELIELSMNRTELITNFLKNLVRVVKPTASIPKPQRSVDLVTLTPVEIVVTGRHDPCIVPRAVPVLENAAAMAVLDLMLLGGFV